MQRVADFEQVRADGNVIPAAMTVREMLARGWGPAKVIALRWTHDGNPVEYAAPNGAHGIVVPGANFVAAILDNDLSGANTRLAILSPNGAMHGTLENSLPLTGIEAEGRYGWFEPAMTPGADTFGVVFQAGAAGEFRCDVDARDLRVLTVAQVR
jgi:hypothetical protein